MTTVKSYDYLQPVRYRSHITRDGSQRPQGPEGRRTTRPGLSHGVNRLTAISSAPSASSVVSFGYGYNNANQRTTVTLGPDRSYWVYGYDSLGQLTNGVKYWYDGVPFAGQQFGYTFDDIGNRKQTTAGGDASGQNQRVAWYTNTPLNQITNRTVPGSNDVIGIAHASATVTVNGQCPYRRGEYYRKEVALTNASAVACQAVTNRAVLAGVTNTQTGNLLAPPRTQQFWYDQDGNLLSDGVWTNTWDAENRLIATETTGPVPTAAKAKETWTYYGDGRWAQRVIYSWSGGNWVAQTTNGFVWDGNLIAAIVDQTNGLVQAFVRGLDLSGTMQGAGGAGGLLALLTGTNGNHFYAFDGNGNVVALVSATNGTETARYEYGPFAEPIRRTGPMAAANPMRFSSQLADDLSGDLKYLYRDYTPSTTRWNSRDPVAERGGVALSAFGGNNAVGFVDVLGLIKGTGPYSCCGGDKGKPWMQLLVDTVVLYGSDDTREADFAKANDIYEQCCIRIKRGGSHILSEAGTKAVLGSDLWLDSYTQPGRPTAEELALTKGQKTDVATAYYIERFQQYDERQRGEAFNFKEFAAPPAPAVVLAKGGDPITIYSRA